MSSAPKISAEKKWSELWEAACPTSEGKGQIFISKKTYSFSYESLINKIENFWAMALEVPLRGEETLVVPLDTNSPFGGSLFLGLDEKTQKSIGKLTLDLWKKSWLELLNFLENRSIWSQQSWKNSACNQQLQCHGKEKNVLWNFTEDQIELKLIQPSTKASFSWKFKRINEELRFSQQVVTLRHQKNSQTISLHLYPTVCGK